MVRVNALAFKKIFPISANVHPRLKAMDLIQPSQVRAEATESKEWLEVNVGEAFLGGSVV